MSEDATRSAKRTTLHPSFAEGIGAVFERAKKGRGFLSIVSPSRYEGPTVSSILEMHDPRHVSALAEQIRRMTEIEWMQRFSARKAWTTGANLRLLKTILSIDPEAAYPLMTMWSGYVREAAVRTLEGIPGPFCLSVLVHRMNDWVAEVRNTAESKLATLQSSVDVQTILGCIELLWDFDRFGRASPSARALVEGLTSKPTVLAALRAEALEGRTDRALRIFQRLLRIATLDDDLASIAATSPHPRIRAGAVRALLTRTHRWSGTDGIHERNVEASCDGEALAREALKDSASVVQLAGLEYIITDGRMWRDYESILLGYAADRRNALAERARWALRAAGVDWVNVLRAALTGRSGPNPDIARALGKFGTQDDGLRICELASALPNDRALPFLAASAQQKTPLALARLTEIAIGESNLELAKRASRALRDAEVNLDADHLKTIADRGNEFFSRGFGRHFRGLSVIAQLNVLARLEKARADFDMSIWFAISRRDINRGRFAPSETEKIELESLLAYAPQLRDWARRQLAIGI